MKKISLLLVAASLIFLTSCININKSIREPNTRVNLNKADFTFSDQMKGEAKTVQILGIDFQRLFMKKTGTVNKDGGAGAPLGINIASIPVVGNILVGPTASYALYDMMDKNPGYDVVFYPQFETTIRRPIGFGFLFKITEVKATARLAKIKQ